MASAATTTTPRNRPVPRHGSWVSSRYRNVSLDRSVDEFRRRAQSSPMMTVISIPRGPIACDDIPVLCERVRVLRGEGVGRLVCGPLRAACAVTPPDARTLDALAASGAVSGCGTPVESWSTCSASSAWATSYRRTDTPESESLGFEPLGQTEEGEQVGRCRGKNVISSIRSPRQIQQLQRPRFFMSTVGARLVLRECGRTVGFDRHQLRADPDPGAEAPGTDVWVALQTTTRREASSRRHPRGAARSGSPCRSARRRPRTARAAIAHPYRWTQRLGPVDVGGLERGMGLAGGDRTTEATDDSSSTATSEAFHRNTSRSTRTARCFGGRCCSAAMKARRIVSRASATSAGSPSAGSTRASRIAGSTP